MKKGQTRSQFVALGDDLLTKSVSDRSCKCWHTHSVERTLNGPACSDGCFISMETGY